MSMIAEHSLALLSTAEMQAADRAAIAAGTPGLELMERAGEAVADAANRLGFPASRVLVLCGPGNNGGDGFVAARLLQARGMVVTIALAGSLDALRGDAATMASRWSGPVIALAAADAADFDLIVDALFGAGLSRPLEGDVAACVYRVNGSGRKVIAVDVPSGLSGDSGRANGVVVQAQETVTFFRLKPGHLLEPGRSLCGAVTLADIGISPAIAFAAADARPNTFRNEPELWLANWPRHGRDTHKFRRGAVLVLAGGLTGVGASRLAARAALRIGAGLATVACRPEALAAHAARGPDALMQRPVPDRAALAELLGDSRLSALLAGPALGLDTTAGQGITALLARVCPLVLDADALTLLSRQSLEALRRACGARGAACVLTPHEGEFARLFGRESEIAQADSKLDRARKAAMASGATIVLKGPDTVIASPDGRAAINVTGSQALATAGSGDVLGGTIAGLLAQGMPAFEAACAAVWVHGRVGETLGLGLIADDLPEAYPAMLAELGRRAS